MIVGKRSLRASALIGVVMGVVTVLVLGFFGVQFLKKAGILVENTDPVHISDQELLNRIEQLRSKGDIREYAAALKHDLESIAQEITAAVPGLTWEWSGESSVGPCYPIDSSWHDVPTVMYSTPFLMFSNSPAPRQYWNKAVDIVARHAAKYGATTQGTKAGNASRVIFHSDPLGPSFDLGAITNTVLQANSGCFLAEDIYHNKFTPQQIIHDRKYANGTHWVNRDIP